MTDSTDRFEDLLREHAASYRPPPATPRDEMWAGIAAARRRRAAARRTQQRRWRWAMGLAAVLILGVAIGRWSAPGGMPVGADNAVVAEAPESALYQAAAAEYLGRAETMLTMFRSEARRGGADEESPEAARSLLATNRLLLDSPVAADPRMRRLLEDLELVLIQIARLSAEQGADPRQFVMEALDQTSVLFRLRAYHPPGADGTIIEGAL